MQCPRCQHENLPVALPKSWHLILYTRVVYHAQVYTVFERVTQTR
jgi:hypothetical protein